MPQCDRVRQTYVICLYACTRYGCMLLNNVVPIP